MQRQIPPPRAFSCSAPTLAPDLTALSVTWLGRPLRNKSSNDMAFPHPKSRKEHYWHEDKPSSRRVVWNLFERTINIAEYRNAKKDVNRAKDPTFGALVHDWLLHGFAILLDSRFLSRPRWPAGRVNTEL